MCYVPGFHRSQLRTVYSIFGDVTMSEKYLAACFFSGILFLFALTIVILYISMVY